MRKEGEYLMMSVVNVAQDPKQLSSRKRSPHVNDMKLIMKIITFKSSGFYTLGLRANIKFEYYFMDELDEM